MSVCKLFRILIENKSNGLYQCDKKISTGLNLFIDCRFTGAILFRQTNYTKDNLYAMNAFHHTIDSIRIEENTLKFRSRSSEEELNPIDLILDKNEIKDMSDEELILFYSRRIMDENIVRAIKGETSYVDCFLSILKQI